MRKLFYLLFCLLFAVNSFAYVKIRDIAKVDGIRDNQLIGYGLVVGLNGTGDKSGTEFTIQSLVNMLDRMGITVDKNKVKVKNVAAVMVTAKLPPFAKEGTRIDVTVSSIGDAKSLEGGTLLMTPLSGPDGKIYAVAQGPLSVGGMNVSSGGGGTVKNHPTVGRIPNGALIEREVPFSLDKNFIVLDFERDSLTDLVKAKNAINRFFKKEIAFADTPKTIKIMIPDGYKDRFYDFLATIMNIEIDPEPSSKVVVDERTGTIVMGSDVRISTVAVSHGNLTIKITNTVEISQPAPLSQGKTVVTTNQNTEVKEEEAKLMVIPEGVRISDLVKALNSLGVTPRDLIAILQAIKAAGALQGDLEVI
ncbi:flagellar basal body P-ring protein FlgI [Deferribacter thermophilus]|uniref:flagellar basal body P-ring protein FlgI n=1 Tax=Deferribacter thermophilus TaxID=53573 RepID=UPI003C27364C